jgi:hypothetical protein
MLQRRGHSIEAGHGLTLGLYLLLLIHSAVCAALATTLRVEELGLPADESRDAALLAQLGPQYRRRLAPHFALISSAAAHSTRDLAAAVEETFRGVRRFAEELGLPVQEPASKMSVVLLRDWAAYESRAQQAGVSADQSTPGFFDEQSNRCLVFDYSQSDLVRRKRREIWTAHLTAAVLKSHFVCRWMARPGCLIQTLATTGPVEGVQEQGACAAEQGRRAQELDTELTRLQRLINQTVVRHEIAHQVLYNLGIQESGDSRRWLKEGLAMQFENLGTINEFRRADFLAVDWANHPRRLRDLVADPPMLAPGAEDLAENYAAAWAMVYYLSRQKPAALTAYIRGRVEPRDAAAALPQSRIEVFESAFGPIDKAFAASLSEFVERSADRGDDRQHGKARRYTD